MSSESAERLTLPVSERDHLEGLANAPAILVEYGDYECPICGAAYVTIKEIQKAMGNRLGFIFRNFPLSEMHPHAKDAAQAAEAAGVQGKFWEMHDMLFENQDDLSHGHLRAYAEALGLDATRLIEEVAAGTYSKHVQEDFRSGIRSGVNGTPTFFINGLRYDGAHDAESMLTALTSPNG